MDKENKSYLGRVKDAVDYIYLLVNDATDGYSSGFQTYDALIQRVASVLVGRGVLCREKAGAKGKQGRIFIYKWGSNMAPTNNLYKVVMSELQEKKRRENARRNRKRNQETQTPSPIVAPSAPKEYVTTLDGFSAQELWDELKKRGYSIEDNRLVIIKKAYLT